MENDTNSMTRDMEKSYASASQPEEIRDPTFIVFNFTPTPEPLKFLNPTLK